MAAPASSSMHFPEDTPACIRLAAFRWRIGLTQSELASRAGVSVQSVKNWERGRSRPSDDGLMNTVFRVLGMTCEERTLCARRIRWERRFQGRRKPSAEGC